MVEQGTNAVDFSLVSPAIRADPGATFAAMRARCPVHHTEEPAPHYSLSLDADVTAALRDEATWSSRFGPGLAYGEEGAGVLVSSDPPKHTGERLAISRAFRPSVIEGYEPRVRALVGELLDDMTSGSADHRVDLIAELAMPIPLTVMCWMLGTPTADISLFRSWVMPMAEGVTLAGGRSASPRVLDAYKQYYAYFGSHVQARIDLSASGATPPDDLLSRLLTVERNGVALTRKEVVDFCQFLLVAGSATTTLLIGNVVHRLLRHPDQLALVRADRSLIGPAIEESLRIDSPVHGLFRTPTCPVTLHGVEIPTDAKVLMLFGSANLDPATWTDPDRFDVTRNPATLKRHTAFGVGVHYCLGAPLARMEATIAVEAVLDRLPGLRADGDPTTVSAQVLKGFDTLPVAWDPVVT